MFNRNCDVTSLSSSGRYHVIQDCYGNWHQYEITVVDLDPKFLSRIEKWRAEEDEMRRLLSQVETKRT